MHLFQVLSGAVFCHTEDPPVPLSSTKTGRPGRYQVIGKYLVEASSHIQPLGWLWLEAFGLVDFYPDVGPFLKRCHQQANLHA